MKACSNYTTTLMTATWFRGSAALLIFATLILGLMALWRTNGQSDLPLVTSSSFARQGSSPIAACRACRDEWAAAHMVQPALALAIPAQRPQATRAITKFRANSSIGACRVCRDERIAAQSLAMPTGGVRFDQPAELFRTSGPR